MTTITNRQELINGMISGLSAVIKEHLERATQCCITCEHFHQTRETCDLVDQRPPAKVIAYGCNRYLEEIPF